MVRQGAAALAASPSLTCSYLSARITMNTNTLSLDNSLGTYGTPEPVSVIAVPGVIDGIYDGG